MVVLGELGGRDEYSLVDALKEGKVQKPVIAWVSGTCARLFKSEVQFGHAVSWSLYILFLLISAIICNWCYYHDHEKEHNSVVLFFLTYAVWSHQGAKSGGELESAQAKNQALREAGAVVPSSYEAFENAIKETFEKLVCCSYGLIHFLLMDVVNFLFFL